MQQQHIRIDEDGIENNTVEKEIFVSDKCKSSSE
jgi:hypothetical protein